MTAGASRLSIIFDVTVEEKRCISAKNRRTPGGVIYIVVHIEAVAIALQLNNMSTENAGD